MNGGLEQLDGLYAAVRILLIAKVNWNVSISLFDLWLDNESALLLTSPSSEELDS